MGGGSAGDTGPARWRLASRLFCKRPEVASGENVLAAERRGGAAVGGAGVASHGRVMTVPGAWGRAGWRTERRQSSGPCLCLSLLDPAALKLRCWLGQG